MTSGTPKRRYDARARRERAAAERAATRERIVAAAAKLFLTNGYAATTVADVAREAGLTAQTVHAVAGTKPRLLELVQAAVLRTGHAEESDGGSLDALRHEPDPRRQIQVVARLLREQAERAAPVWLVMREAALRDEAVALLLREHHALRHTLTRRYVDCLGDEHLRPGLSRAAATDTAWVVTSPEVILLLLHVRGWTFDALEGYFADSLTRLLVQD